VLKGSPQGNGNDDGGDRQYYPKEPPALPQYDISPKLKKLVLMFMGGMVLNFMIAGSLAIGMRIIQADVPIFKVDWIPQNVLFYALLTAHGQVMLFGVICVNTVWFSYYAMSKWGRKPLLGMKLARASFWAIEAAVVLIFIATLLGFGAGWYNLMPLTFLPGRPMMAWGDFSVALFLTADVLVGIFLTLFCIVIILTALKGKLGVGIQHREDREYIEKSGKYYDQDNGSDAGSMDERTEDLPATVRWVSLLGIVGWFTKKWRSLTPHVSIVVVAVFVTALIQIIGNPGLFLQLGHGFMSLEDPTAAANWLLTKQAWWFFAHPIVYFPTLVFLGAAYYFFASAYGRNRVPYDKWNYRPWPFYFIFSVLVYNHHIFMDMPNPVWLQILSQAATLGIVWPSGMTIATLLHHIWRNKITWNITARFLMVGIAGWAFGGFQGATTGVWGLDVYQHNTMALPGHIHFMLLAGALPMAFGVLYAIMPDLTKKHLNKTLGEIHFWGTTVAIFALAFLFTQIGIDGAIRREADMPGAYDWAMPWLLFFALVIGVTQFVFLYNFVKTLKRKPSSIEMQNYEALHKVPQGMGLTQSGR